MPDASDRPQWATPEFLAWLRQLVAANIARLEKDETPPRLPDGRTRGRRCVLGPGST